MSNEIVQVSPQVVQVYMAFANRSGQWLTNQEVAGATPDVSLRTVRAATVMGIDLGEARAGRRSATTKA